MIRRFFSSFILVLIGLGCAFLTQAILAKTLSASEYGVFSFIFSISLLLGVFSLFGFQNSAVKIISIFQTGQSDNKTKEFCQFSLLYSVSLALILSSVVYLILSFTNLSQTYPTQAMFLGFVMTPLMVIIRLHSAFLRGLSKSGLSVLFETSLREILFLFIILSVLIFGWGLETGFQALCYLVMALFLSSLCAWMTSWCHVKNIPILKSKADWAEKKEWIKLSFPMMLIIFSQRLLRRSDIIILGLMMSPAIVGAYAIAAQFSEASSIGQKSVFAVFSPKAAALHKQGKKDELKSLFGKMQWIGIISMAILCGFIISFAPAILNFFGEDYAIAYRSTLILLAGQFLNICFGPVGILMIMAGREKEAMRQTMTMALANIILNPIAIYFYGMEGAAIVTSVLLVYRGLTNYHDVKRNGII